MKIEGKPISNRDMGKPVWAMLRDRTGKPSIMYGRLLTYDKDFVTVMTYAGKHRQIHSSYLKWGKPPDEF